MSEPTCCTRTLGLRTRNEEEVIATQSQPRRRPRRSREEVSTALIEAAAALFAERPSGHVTVRDIAARADVNPALINRYFGSKHNLLRAVVRDVQRKMVVSVQEMPDMVEGAPLIVGAALREREFIHLVAQATIDVELGGLASEYPALGELVQRFAAEMEEHGITDRDPRMVVASLSCLTFGYVMFGEFVRAATGLADEPDEEVRAGITDTLRMIAAAAVRPVQTAGEAAEPGGGQLADERDQGDRRAGRSGC